MAALLPWEAIRAEYVKGNRDSRGGVTYPTYEDLARKYTCSDTTIRQRGGREHWGAARTAYQLAHVREAQHPEKTRTRVASLIEETALSCASRGLARLDVLMNALDGRSLFEHERRELIDLEKCIGILSLINGMTKMHGDNLPPAA